jgi:hypothetical protein
VATSQESSHGGTGPEVASEPSETSWPVETDLLTLPGTNKVILTVQRPLMRAVFQDAFNRIRAAMVFRNAFPNVYETITMITDSLILAAESNPRANDIYNRLLIDGDYTTSMSRLVSVQISDTMLLTLSLAPGPHSSFPCGGKGSLCGHCSGRVLGHSRTLGSHSSC